MRIINNSKQEENKIKKITSLNIPENIICFSHLRWDFVFQRPQHLLTRFAAKFNIFFIEEPVFDTDEQEFYSFQNGLKIFV